MSFIQTILKNIDDDPFMGSHFTKSEWVTILNAFDAYTPNFKANVLGTEDDVSELNTIDSIATFLETIVANVRAIDLKKTQFLILVDLQNILYYLKTNLENVDN